MTSINIFISLLIALLICIGISSPVLDKILIDPDNSAYVFTTTTPPSILEIDQNANAFKGRRCWSGAVFFNGKCVTGMNANIILVRKVLMSLSLFFSTVRMMPLFKL